MHGVVMLTDSPLRKRNIEVVINQRIRMKTRAINRTHRILIRAKATMTEIAVGRRSARIRSSERFYRSERKEVVDGTLIV